MNNLCKTLNRLNADKKIKGKHPLLSLKPDLPLRISYFQGIVLAAVVDDGKIADMEKEYLRRLGVTLALTSEDVKECIQTISEIRSVTDQELFLQELTEVMTEKSVSVLFLGDFIRISMMPDHNKEKLYELAKAFAEYLDITNAVNFFLELFSGKDVDQKSCPAGLLPYLDYFCGNKAPQQTNNSATEELKKFIDASAYIMQWIGIYNKKQSIFGNQNKKSTTPVPEILETFLKKHPDFSLVSIRQIFLPCVQKQFALLKKAINSVKGVKKSSRFNVDLATMNTYHCYMRYVCFMDGLTTANPDFYMACAVPPPKEFYWTEVKTPEKEAKKEVIQQLAVYLEELENRIK